MSAAIELPDHAMAMAMATDRVLLSRDDRTISMVEIAMATPPTLDAATVGFRIVVVQCYGAGVGVGGDAGEEDDDADTMEDVACRVPVDELMIKESGRGAAAAAAAIDRAFQELVSKLDHPTLIPEVSPEARKAAATVRAICAEREAAALAGVEFRLRVVFLDEEEPEPESDSDSEEEVGSDLELDDECWELGQIDCDGGSLVHHGHFASEDGGEWRYEHGEDGLRADDEDEHNGGQFTPRPFDGALTREGGPSDGTLLLSGFEAGADGPDELGDQQHELTPRDVRRLVRLAFSGGDVEGDEAYRRAMAAGGEPVSPATLAAMLDRALRSVTQRPPAPSGSGMPPGRMRTGW